MVIPINAGQVILGVVGMVFVACIDYGGPGFLPLIFSRLYAAAAMKKAKVA